MNIISAKYVANPEDPTEMVRIQCYLGNDRYKSVVIDDSRESYQKIMEMVDAGDLTIADADPITEPD